MVGTCSVQVEREAAASPAHQVTHAASPRLRTSLLLHVLFFFSSLSHFPLHRRALPPIGRIELRSIKNVYATPPIISLPADAPDTFVFADVLNDWDPHVEDPGGPPAVFRGGLPPNE
jgi:hypothetical protein